MPLIVYYVRDGRLAPTRAFVPPTPAVAGAALRALSKAAPDGYKSAASDTEDLKVKIVNGVAEIDWPQKELSHLAAAQVVYTLTQFPTIRNVRLPDGTVAERHAFEDVTPPIVIENPLPGDTVRSPISVLGTASVYEATLVVELVQDGEVVEKHNVTASTGAPERGTFWTSFDTEITGRASVVAFSPSADDGSEQHRVEVPVRVE